MRLSVACGFLFALALAGSAQEDASVNLLFVREKGSGSAAQAQPYVDQLGGLLSARMRWTAAKIPYYARRSDASAFIKDARPRYAFLSLSAFLALRQEHRLEVLGTLEFMGSGQRFHVVSRNARTLDACKGKVLTSQYTDDVRFLDAVVFADAAKSSEFTLLPAARPIQAIKKIVSNEAECALIDDALLADLARISGAEGIQSVWKSASLPTMVVAAFPSAPAEERKRFRELLPGLTEGEGQKLCEELGIKSVRTAGDKDLEPLIAAYDKK